MSVSRLEHPTRARNQPKAIISKADITSRTRRSRNFLARQDDLAFHRKICFLSEIVSLRRSSHSILSWTEPLGIGCVEIYSLQ